MDTIDRMAFTDDLSAYAAVLTELAPVHRISHQRWPGRSDLPTRVDAFWRAIGASKLTESAVPRATSDEDRAGIRERMAEWFANPAVRNRLGIPDGADPSSAAIFGTRPRLLDANPSRVLLCDDADGEDPKPFGLEIQDTERRPLGVSCTRWTAHRLLVRGTSMCWAVVPTDPIRAQQPAPVLLPSLARLADGLYVVGEVQASDTSSPRFAMFSAIARYVDWVLSRPAGERGRWLRPSGWAIEVKLPKKGLALDPRKPVEPGLVTFESEGPHAPRPPNHFNAIGRIDGRAVWISPIGVDEIRIVSDVDDAGPLLDRLRAARAKVVHSALYRRTLPPAW